MIARRRAVFLGTAGLLLAATAVSVIATASAAPAAVTYHAHLRGFKEVPPNASSATGFTTVVLNDTETQITVTSSFSGLSSPANGAHIHEQVPGVNGAIVFPFSGVPAATSGTIGPETFAISAAQVAKLKAGDYYVNIHSNTLPGGEIRGQIVLKSFTAALDGGEEVPPTGSTATGVGEVGLSGDATRVIADLSWSGLSSEPNGTHIHNAPPGMEAGVLFDVGPPPAATSGRISEKFFAVTAAQVAELEAGNWYFNVHTGNFPDGEIRGQITLAPTAVRVASASAVRTPRGVLVRWRTATDAGTLGFNVYRREPGRLVKLNRALISAVFAGTTRGRAYSWLDRGAVSGARYRIELVALDGARSWVASPVAR